MAAGSPSGALARIAPGAAALGAGALVAAALPPWGWWPLAFAGIAVLDALLADQPRRVRLRRGWLFGLGWIAPGTGWMWFLTAPGYVVVCLLFSFMVGLAVWLAPGGRGRRLGLVGALVLPEALRLHWPFGGVPLATLAVGQAAGPLAPVARLGGILAVGMVTVAVGMGLAAAWRKRWLPAGLFVGGAVVAVVAGTVAPHGRVVGARTLALVQGGGEQGTRAVNSDPRIVMQRHLDATGQLPRDVPIDAVVWPENVIDVDEFVTSDERAAVAAAAGRLGAPMVVGITENSRDGDHFLNAQVVVTPQGAVVSRYEKVRRVPFGEYMPLRSLLTAVGAPTDLVPRDAVAGTGPAFVDVPRADGGRSFRAAVVISWEVFFGDRARDGVRHGGEVLMNPTNGSSYTGTVLQSQQVASSRLRAIETGRWVTQVAPTGFSAFVSPDGHVYDRTGQRERTTRVRSIELRRGLTPYTRLGDLPWGLAALAVLGAGWLVARRPVRASEVVAPTGDEPPSEVPADR